jgi:O-acetyl-ADP-ribose deacetylase (regulator of RNase III)
MPYREYRGNIFASNAQVLVNTVNCVGVMGKGVALEFRRRFPAMFEEYQRVCAARTLMPGQILPYRKGRPWVLNFAVKNDWRHPSRMEWVESCLRKFVESYSRLGIRSVAMPWIGAMNGKLPWDAVHALMRSYLGSLTDLDVEVVEFDPGAADPLFEPLRIAAGKVTPPEFAHEAGVTESAATLILKAVRTGEASNLAAVAMLDRLGGKTVDRLYAFLRCQQEKALPIGQPHLI